MKAIKVSTECLRCGFVRKSSCRRCACETLLKVLHVLSRYWGLWGRWVDRQLFLLDVWGWSNFAYTRLWRDKLNWGPLSVCLLKPNSVIPKFFTCCLKSLWGCSKHEVAWKAWKSEYDQMHPEIGCYDKIR